MSTPPNTTNWMSRLKAKWGIRRNRDFWAIMLAFSLAGMFVAQARRPLFNVLGLQQAALWIKTCAYLALVFPLYQISLLTCGTLLGQGPFFWTKQKRLLRVLCRRP